MWGYQHYTRMGVDLSLKDIRFLRAVRDINNDPESFAKTDRGEVPANKSSIREATGMNSKAVEYRLGNSGTHRGFGQDDLGLINIHSPTIEGNTFGPKSAELTSKGLEELSKVEDEGLLGGDESSGGSDNEAIKQLRARIDEIESTEFTGDGDVSAGELASMVKQVRTQVDELETKLDTRYESLAERVDEIEAGNDQGEWGYVNEQKAEDIEGMLTMAPAIAFAWSEVFGISLEEIIQADDMNQEMIDQYRATAAEKLDSVDEADRYAEDEEIVFSDDDDTAVSEQPSPPDGGPSKPMVDASEGADEGEQ